MIASFISFFWPYSHHFGHPWKCLLYNRYCLSFRLIYLQLDFFLNSYKMSFSLLTHQESHTLCYYSDFILIHALFSTSFRFLDVNPHTFMTHIWHQLYYVFSFLIALNRSESVLIRPSLASPFLLCHFNHGFCQWMQRGQHPFHLLLSETMSHKFIVFSEKHYQGLADFSWIFWHRS